MAKQAGCWNCGRPTEHGKQFDTDYCAAKYAEQHGIPFLEETDWERES